MEIFNRYFSIFLLIIFTTPYILNQQNKKSYKKYISFVIIIAITGTTFLQFSQEIHFGLSILLLFLAWPVYKNIMEFRAQISSLNFFRDIILNISDYKNQQVSLNKLCKSYSKALAHDLNCSVFCIEVKSTVTKFSKYSTDESIEKLSQTLFAKQQPIVFCSPLKISNTTAIPIFFQENVLANYKSHGGYFFFIPIELETRRKGFFCGISTISDLALLKLFFDFLTYDAKLNLLLLGKHVNQDTQNLLLNQQIESRTLELQQKNKELKKKEKKILEFYSTLSHDIRTPLSMITIPLDSLIHNSKKLSQLQQRHLQKVRLATYRTIGLVTSLLDISKIDSEKNKFNASLVDMRKPLELVAELFRNSIESNGMKYHLKICSGSVVVNLDSEKFEKIITNLISNAIKYNKPNGKILIKLNTKNKSAFLDIIDEGKGIEANELPKIFKRYHMAKDSKAGTGIGLALVKEFVRQHKGKIVVESRPQRITRFRLIFPLAKKELVSKSHFWQDHFFANVVSEQLISLASFQKNRLRLPVIALVPYPFPQGFRDPIEELKIYYHILIFSNISTLIKQMRVRLPDIIIAAKLSGREFKSLLKVVEVEYIPLIMLGSKIKSFETLETYRVPKDFNLNELWALIEKLINENKLRARLKNYSKAFENSRDQIHQLKRMFLPKKKSTLPQFNVWDFFETAYSFTGSGFNFKKGKNGSLLVLLFDITGHEVHAFWLSLLVQKIFNEVLDVSSPDLVFEKITESVKEYSMKNSIIFFIAKIEKNIASQKYKVNWASAGFPAVFVNINNSFIQLEQNNLPYALSRKVNAKDTLKWSYKTFEGNLIRLMAYNTGFYFLHNKKAESIDEKYFLSIFKNRKNFSEIHIELKEVIDRQKEKLPQDLCLLYIESSFENIT